MVLNIDLNLSIDNRKIFRSLGHILSMT